MKTILPYKRFLITGACIIVLIAGGYIVYQKDQTAEHGINNPVLKTYTNVKRGYSIKYPDTLAPKESTESMTEFVNGNNPADLSHTFTIAIFDRAATAEPFSEYVKHAYYTDENMTDARLSSITKVITAKRVIGYETKWTDSKTIIYFPLPHDDTSGLIAVIPSEGSAMDNQIISSFEYK